MSIPLMIFSLIIIGVAVDDTIHFFMRYRRECNRTGTYEGALKATLDRGHAHHVYYYDARGRVFGLWSFGHLYYTTVHFGLLASFAFLWALLANFSHDDAAV